MMMDPALKNDWAEAGERIEAWWHGEYIGRPAIMAIGPLADRPLALNPPASLADRWADPAWRLAELAHEVQLCYYGGEWVPSWCPNLGPSIMGAFLGARLEFAEATSWQHPMLASIEEAADLQFNPENAWWKLTVLLTAEAVKIARRRFLVGITDLGMAADVLAYLRGAENLLMDLVLSPEAVKCALRRLQDLWYRYYEELFALISANNDGLSFGWTPVPVPGRSYVLQNDMSCMVSPAMFEEFFLEEIREATERLDRTIYHLDGPGAIKHLDALLTLPCLTAIQWIPGDGAPPPREWGPLIRKIRTAGKPVQMYVPAEDVLPLFAELGPTGLLPIVYCRSEREARDLIEAVGRIRCR